MNNELQVLQCGRKSSWNLKYLAEGGGDGVGGGVGGGEWGRQTDRDRDRNRM
jgi:hypothetical protein